MRLRASAREISRTLAFLKSAASANFSARNGSGCSAIRSRITRWKALPFAGKSSKSLESCASDSAACFSEFFNAKMSFFLIVGFKRLRSRTTDFEFLPPALRLDVSCQFRRDQVYVRFDDSLGGRDDLPNFSEQSRRTQFSVFFTCLNERLFKRGIVNKQCDFLPFSTLILRYADFL